MNGWMLGWTSVCIGDRSMVKSNGMVALCPMALAGHWCYAFLEATGRSCPSLGIHNPSTEHGNEQGPWLNRTSFNSVLRLVCDTAADHLPGRFTSRPAQPSLLGRRLNAFTLLLFILSWLVLTTYSTAPFRAGLALQIALGWLPGGQVPGPVEMEREEMWCAIPIPTLCLAQASKWHQFTPGETRQTRADWVIGQRCP
jgi:hypothetical protein